MKILKFCGFNLEQDMDLNRVFCGQRCVRLGILRAQIYQEGFRVRTKMLIHHQIGLLSIWMQNA